MHTVNIPQKVIDACIRRRGTLHVYDRVDPATTALVVVDMQNAWLEPGFSPVEIPMARSIVGNVNRLAAAVRKAGGLVAWTQSTFPVRESPSYSRFASPEWHEKVIADTAVGSFGHAIADCMAVAPEDLTVTKTRPSAFIQGSSDLDEMLRERGRNTLIITGTLTNACCESSARDASALGYDIIFVSDATATRTDEEHNAALTNLIQFVADVMTTDEVIARLPR